ncbi:MAG TPA: hypothetical protein VJ895_00945 [Candidatus Nanoarchaeia archaeon]|nr:hypothetical protein [Candidatus Nanoarchaeia archaeon]
MKITAKKLNGLASNSLRPSIHWNSEENTNIYHEEKYTFNPEPNNTSEPIVEIPIQKKIKLKFKKPQTLKFTSVENEDGFIDE